VKAALYVGIGAVAIAYVSMTKLEETFGKDLNYVEKH
jgi:hypothetical protein